MSSDPFVEEEIGSTVCPTKEHLWNLLKKWSQVVERGQLEKLAWCQVTSHNLAKCQVTWSELGTVPSYVTNFGTLPSTSRDMGAGT